MDRFYFGKLIHDERIRQGATQGELCAGLCEPPTLSRIESGKRQPSRELLIVLLQRLGITADRYYGLNSFDELPKEDLKEEIKNSGARFERERALTLLDELQQGYDCTDNISRQFVLTIQATNGTLTDGNAVLPPDERCIVMLHEAIGYTVPNLDLDNICGSLLGIEELIILMNIANTHGRLGERRKAIDIYRQLLRYIDKHWLPCSETANFLPLLTYNYSRMLGHEKRFEEELEIVERGLAHCRRYGKSRMLGELLINKSCAQHELGQEPEGLENAKLAYYVLRAMAMDKQAEKVRQYVFDTYSQTNISQAP